MFEHHFGLRENPFVAGHHARFVYPSPEHQEALAHLRFGIENREPFVLITGEVGTGKTTAIYDALAEWQTRVHVALITNSALTRNELLEEIALRFGVSLTGGTSKPQVIAQLERFLLAIHQRGDRAILLLDEAQNLERDLLEEIRLLSNLEVSGTKLMQVFLVGQPELEAKLARPELRQLRQRITVHYRLSPLTAEDTERYIHHRISVAGGHALTIFPSAACREVFGLTHGIPREINNVCAQALLNAFVEDAGSVSPEQVLAAANDTEFQSVIVRGTEALPGKVVHVPESMGKVEVISFPPREADDPTDEFEDEELEDQAKEEAAAPAAELTPPRLEYDAPPAWVPEPPVALPTPPPAPASPEPPTDTPPMVGAPVPRPPVVAAPPIPPVATPPLVVEPIGAAPTPLEPISIPAIDSWISARIAPRPEGESAAPEDTPETSPVPPTPRAGEVAPVARTAAKSPPAVAEAPSASRVAPAPSLSSRIGAQAEPPWVKPPFEGPSGGRAMSPPPAIRSLAEEQRAALPPRLRAKLEAEPDEGTPGSNKALRLFAGAGVVAALAIVTILLMRFGPWVKHPPGPDAVVPNEPPTATSALHPEHESTSPTPGTGVTEMHGSAPSAPVKAPVIAGPTPSATRSATPSRPVVRAPAPTRTVSTSSSPTTSTSAPTAAGAVPSRTALVAPATKAGPPRAAYGVAVATFLFEDRATTEREKLAAGTGLTARIVTAREDGTDVYRLVLGSYPDRATAERGASDLVRRGLVDEARVVSLPKAAPAKP